MRSISDWLSSAIFPLLIALLPASRLMFHFSSIRMMLRPAFSSGSWQQLTRLSNPDCYRVTRAYSHPATRVPPATGQDVGLAASRRRLSDDGAPFAARAPRAQLPAPVLPVKSRGEPSPAHPIRQG